MKNKRTIAPKESQGPCLRLVPPMTDPMEEPKDEPKTAVGKAFNSFADQLDAQIIAILNQ